MKESSVSLTVTILPGLICDLFIWPGKQYCVAITNSLSYNSGGSEKSRFGSLTLRAQRPGGRSPTQTEGPSGHTVPMPRRHVRLDGQVDRLPTCHQAPQSPDSGFCLARQVIPCHHFRRSGFGGPHDIRPYVGLLTS